VFIDIELNYKLKYLWFGRCNYYELLNLLTVGVGIYPVQMSRSVCTVLFHG